MLKCSSLWNKVNRPKSSEQILAILGSQLKYPVVTRWNSLYDSIKALLTHKETLNHLCTVLQIQKFNESDYEYLEEYLKLLKPIADAVDFLKNDKQMAYGYLLPTLATVRNQYFKMRNANAFLYFTIAIPLLEEALKKRFEKYFLLKEEVYDAVVAAVLCPEIKLKWIGSLNSSFNSATVGEITDLVRKIVLNGYNSDSSQETRLNECNHKYFDFVCTEDSTDAAGISIAPLDNEYCAYLADPSTNTEILNRYPSIKKAYIKYNTPNPSSAAVERLFSIASLINAPRRGCLSDSNFEKLLMLKINNDF